MNTKVIVITPLASEYVCVQLQMLGVVGLFLKPCLLGAVVNCIRDVQMQLVDAENDWCVEDEVDRILLNLGFSMGRSGYCFTRDALMYKFVNPNASATKCVYPDVAKRFGGTSTQVEKAIRDAIKFAWKNGNVQVWQMYFPPGNHMQTECPSNEVFLNRIAMILTSKTRIRKPYQKAGLIAK
jgi:two-component system response regulator (stage 0 sporulation protein A)